MSDIKIKQKNLVIFLVIFCLVIFFLTVHNKKCTNLDTEHLPIIYAITPTYTRPVQKAELTRLSHIFTLVPNLHWIIIEDADTNSQLIINLLTATNLINRSTLLAIKTPVDFKLKQNDPNWSKPRGVEQRNAGLKWIRNHLQTNPTDKHSIVYFMDDDNTYSIELFHEMSLIKRGKVGVWPVGLVGGLMVEKPILNEDNSEVIGFNSVWHPERPFPIDMAGFGISSDLLVKHSDAAFSYDVQRGYQESEILRYLTVLHDLQPLANNCKDVLVWHTRTEAPKLEAETKLKKDGQRSDLNMEV